MVNHVKLEIAIQLVAEKIAGIYNKIDASNDAEEIEAYNEALKLAYTQKELVAQGDATTINLILNERRKKK